ncbi:MAG: hypothetical protein HYX97_01175 [Chloroflexi bacterium]|nr:hypothetical protein [Chloroflexota bacterium]
MRTFMNMALRPRPPASSEQPDGTPLQEYALGQLQRIVSRLKTYEGQPVHDTFYLRLLKRVAYAFYRECQDAGVTAEAIAILHSLTQPVQKDDAPVSP